MHCCNINKSRRGGFFLVHLVDLTTIPAVQGSIMRIAGEELERVAVDNVLMMIVDLRRKEG